MCSQSGGRGALGVQDISGPGGCSSPRTCWRGRPLADTHGPTRPMQRGNEPRFSLRVFVLGNVINFHEICCLR